MSGRFRTSSCHGAVRAFARAEARAAGVARPSRWRVQLGELDRRLSKLVRGEVARLLSGLLADEGMNLQPACASARPNTLVHETRRLPHSPTCPDERGDEPDQLAGARPVRAVEQRLGGAKRRGDVSPPPRVGHREDRRLGPSDGELLDGGTRDRLAVRPCRELLDLGREVADVLPDRLDERATSVSVGGAAKPRRTARRPISAAASSRRRRRGPGRPWRPPWRAPRRVLIPSPTSARTVVGAGAARYASISFTSAAFHASTPSTTTSAGLPAEEAERVAGGDRVRARRLRRRGGCSVASSPIRPRSRWSAKAIFGRSRPRQEVDRLQRALVRHAAKHRPLPRPHSGPARRPAARRDLRAGDTRERAGGDGRA